MLERLEMGDAPEQIWIFPENQYAWWPGSDSDPALIGYIRSDLHDALEAERDALKAENERQGAYMDLLTDRMLQAEAENERLRLPREMLSRLQNIAAPTEPGDVYRFTRVETAKGSSALAWCREYLAALQENSDG